MKINLSHIVTGWSKSLGLYEVTEEEKELSKKRLEACAVCPYAKESSFLKLVRGSANNIPSIYCTKCGCPSNEKSLVLEETCPENNWIN